VSYNYVVLGAGRQGTAVAYDLMRYGEAQELVIADCDSGLAHRAADRVNSLVPSTPARAATVNVTDQRALTELLRGADAIVSAVPYRFNADVATAAIASRTSMCDLGGNTDIVRKELALDKEAREALVSIIPDCGLMPGMGNTLAVYAMSRIAQPHHVRIFVGGLPRHPRPPFDYLLTFHIGGLSNEYAGDAIYLRNGRIAHVPVFTELEMLDFPEPVGRCEAFVTSGGTSTCPWSFQDTLLTYEEKTVRYPGHCAAFRSFADLGLLDLAPVEVEGTSTVPREVFHTLLEPKITFPQDDDLVALRILCNGEDEDGQQVQIKLEVIDFQDANTGFRAMERMTGFPAAIVAYLMATGQTPRGAVPLERSVDAEAFLAEWRKRDLPLDIEVS